MANRSFLFGTGGGSGRDFGLLILRVAFGGLMLTHGWGKFQTLLSGGSAGFPDPLGVGPQISLVLAVSAEVLCASALVLGLLTRLALVPLITTMAVAFFLIHGSDPFGERELALVYLAAYVGLLFTGPGRYSADAMLGRRRSSRFR